LEDQIKEAQKMTNDFKTKTQQNNETHQRKQTKIKEIRKYLTEMQNKHENLKYIIDKYRNEEVLFILFYLFMYFISVCVFVFLYINKQTTTNKQTNTQTHIDRACFQSELLYH
jgi:hypothetical protein